MPYEKFDAWKSAHQLALEVYAATEHWPTSERYQLTAQIRRAALSTPTNIAEGAAKRGLFSFRLFTYRPLQLPSVPVPNRSMSPEQAHTSSPVSLRAEGSLPSRDTLSAW
jgi:23S rRNA-intervening sequence protein